MAVKFQTGVNWEYYGIDILKYEYLKTKGGRSNFIKTDELREELQKEGVDENAVRKRFMGIE